MHRTIRILTLSAAALAAGAAPGRAQDPVPLYPENYTVLMENDHVRVVDFRLKKGATEATHSHPAHVAVFLENFTIRFTLPDGTTRMRVARKGEAAYSDATSHASENVGGADAHGILVELKTPPGAGPVNAFTLIHGIPGREVDLKEHLLSLAAPTRAEPGAIVYDLHQHPEKKHEFVRHEVWRSLEDLEAHKRSPHLRASFEKRRREGWTTEIALWDRVEEPAAAADASSGAGRIERLDPRLDALIPPGAVVETLAGGFDWAEGPVWDPRTGALLVSDVPLNAIFRWKEGAGVASFLGASGYSGKEPFRGREPGSNGLALDPQGRLLICQHGDRRVVRRESDGTITVLADRYEGRRLNSPNDLVLRPNGDVWFTDPPFGLPGTFDDPGKELAFQGVFRRAASGSLTAVIKDLRAPNGLGFSPDGRTLYVSNAERERPIWMAYEVRPDGTVGGGRQFAEAAAYVKEGEGVPDGLDVDAAGNLFAAGPGGVHVFSPDGARLGRIETGVPTGNLSWGGDGSDLYITANHRILRVRTLTRGAGS